MDYNTEQTLYVSDNQQKAKFGIGKIIALFVLTVIISVLMGAGGVLLFFHYNPGYTSNTVTNINKTEKEVTVTDTGIADVLEVTTESVKLGKVSGEFKQVVAKKDGTVCAEATVSWACVTTEGRPSKIPEDFLVSGLIPEKK